MRLGIILNNINFILERMNEIKRLILIGCYIVMYCYVLFKIYKIKYDDMKKIIIFVIFVVV